MVSELPAQYIILELKIKRLTQKNDARSSNLYSDFYRLTDWVASFFIV